MTPVTNKVLGASRRERRLDEARADLRFYAERTVKRASNDEGYDHQLRELKRAARVVDNLGFRDPLFLLGSRHERNRIIREALEQAEGRL